MPFTNLGSQPPAITSFTTVGTSSFTVPFGAKALKVLVVGGGGGGGGSGTSNGGNSGAGGASTFGPSGNTGLITANGGNAVGYQNIGSAGGTPSVGTGVTVIKSVAGGQGQAGSWESTAVSGLGPQGGSGGNNPLGGGAGGSNQVVGVGYSGAANTGGGGSGGGLPNSTAGICGSGAGAGAYVEGLILAPVIGTVYTVVVGAGGTGGPAGGAYAGGNGGSGVVTVEVLF